GTNKLAFGSDRFAPFIRPTRTGLGNVTCGQVKNSSNPNIHSLDCDALKAGVFEVAVEVNPL
ncbi:hypothetical protein, partial [Herminiimonas sp.]|uniref:hypothetical protein n=1 Tax=Herminiimonas sp. TaxID=1926289 RepID=UPI002725C361